jgi:hypothetical protein
MAVVSEGSVLDRFDGADHDLTTVVDDGFDVFVLRRGLSYAA